MFVYAYIVARVEAVLHLPGTFWGQELLRVLLILLLVFIVDNFSLRTYDITCTRIVVGTTAVLVVNDTGKRRT